MRSDLYVDVESKLLHVRDGLTRFHLLSALTMSFYIEGYGF